MRGRALDDQGPFKTRLFIQEHWTNLDLDGEATSENIRAKHFIDVRGHGYAPRAPEPLKALAPLLKPAILNACTNEKGDFDPHALLALIANGQRVFA